MICRKDVPWPWPWSWVPVAKVRVPVGSKRSSACSISPKLVDATVLETPMPRSLPRACDSSRRASKPAWSALSEAILQVLAEIAAVIGVGERGLERHGVGRNGVAPAQLGRIDRQLAGGEIHHGLQHIGRLRPAGAAVVAGHHGVGEHARHLDMDGGDHVGAGQHAQIVGGRSGVAVGAVIGADIGERAHPQGQKAALPVERELGLADIVAAMLVGQDRLAALGHPFHRPAGEPGGERGQRIFRIERALHAEAAAHIVGDDAEPGLRNP